MAASKFTNLHVAILSSPGMGHLIPVLVLANRLAAVHSATVTVFSVAANSKTVKNLSLSKLVTVVELPPVDISKIVDSTTAQIVTKLCVMVRESLPLLRSAIAAMSHRPHALIADHFGMGIVPIADEFGMAKYLYIPSNAWFTALTVYCPVLDEEIVGHEYVDLEDSLIIPGCKPVRPEDVVDPMMDRSDQQYAEYLRMGEEIRLFDGVLLNSWEELEPKTLKALRDNEILSVVMNKVPVYPIGPLTRPVDSDLLDRDLKDWLDRQPDESVIFVSFGSGGTLSYEQMIELAWGLEFSGQRFVWVVRGPARGRADEAFWGGNSDGTPEYLPNGFLTRTANVGVLVPNWTEQVEILSHPSVGGFMSHCGWNSTLESIWSGVPLISWPLYAEQMMNAAMLSEEVGVAMRSRRKGGVVVGREEISGMVRRLMVDKEGEVIRERVKELRNSAKNAIGEEGSSYKLMCELLSKIVVKKDKLSSLD